MIDFENGEIKVLKWIAGGYKIPVTIERKGERLWFRFPFNKKITEQIKEDFSGYKWHGYENPPIKQWSVRYCYHNLFRIDHHCNNNPYSTYDRSLDGLVTSKPAKLHQMEIGKHILTYKKVIIAGEMGVGKTLSVFIAAEAAKVKRILWVAPKSALYSVQLEVKKWQSNLNIEYCTYSGLKKLVENWTPGELVYDMVVFDEGHKLKTPTSQRTQAAAYLADHVRREHGDAGFIILMTGTPAPKSPIDWYSICEIVCPGFLKEGDIYKFKDRLGIIQERENTMTGGTFPHLVTWLDDERKCLTCGEFAEHDNHTNLDHIFRASKNEVAYLYERMKGLVLVKWKKDCVNLPDKNYRIINCKVSRELERAAKLTVSRANSTIKALTFLRELSDGFQYTEVPDGTETCPACAGERVLPQMVYCGPEITEEDVATFNREHGFLSTENTPSEQVFPCHEYPTYYKSETMACGHCSGAGEVTKYIRTVEEVKCPKDDILRDLLEEYDETGRFVCYAGYTGSIDRVCRIIEGQGWTTIRVDGRGWKSKYELPAAELLELFQSDSDEKIAFVGHPASAGMGLTLTASKVIAYFSNDFNAEARIQSEDRIHRMGMGDSATIIDIFNLPTDRYVYDNLKKKRDLQSLSLGQLTEALNKKDYDEYV